MIRRPPRSTLDRSSAASDVYKRQKVDSGLEEALADKLPSGGAMIIAIVDEEDRLEVLSLIHISEPTRPY